ncbi:MFS transporter [Sphingomonas japonica]|uniref:MHS family alpha-ketoglutarate permease-like MFS transporter n=1 Tax=Sphingomonas japonica TaxID=511662 RepID=A0ABX0U1A3_9SPHN|nr:MFS transporter [Sphingomonas japonica]NIJ24335.1 MHS family alpha-ketoglutarate permease-like MFS transporter [Sphingomonas japonica]
MTHSGSRLRSIIGGSAGNLVEWYDWYAYAAFTLYFAPHFFPSDDPTVELLQAAAVFALGFFMRPIGGWLMGVYSDRRGRKAGLTLSVTLMCFGSLLIAITPTYATIGVAAPALLLTARLLQGLSVGGEYGASATYLSEMGGRKHRGFFASFQYVTLIGGQLVALAVLILLQNLLSEAALDQWGWRIPFVIGGLLAIGVFWLRQGLAETESFAKVDQAAATRSGFWPLLRHHPRETVTVLALTAGGTLAFYAYSIYMQKFLVNTSGFSRETASAISAGTLLIFMCLQPVVGALSDRIGRKPVMIAFGVFGVLFTYPIFSTLAATRDPATAFAICLAALVIVSGYSAISGVVKAEMYPAHIRTLGVALPYAIANALFGGTAEYIALWFKDSGFEEGFYWYVTAMIGVSLVTYATMRDTRDHSLIVED